jgi:hypothetical protein
LGTQSLEDLRQSALLPVVVESCPSKIFLANPGMDRSAYRDTFHLNEVEVETISRLIPKRQLLLKRPDIAKVLTLNVDIETLRLFGAPPDAMRAPQPLHDLTSNSGLVNPHASERKSQKELIA